MRVFVVGANGRLGRRVVAQALARGHSVTAFVRDRSGLPEHPALTVEMGAVADQPDRVRDTLAGHDAVLSALGNPLWLKANRGPAIVAPATANLVAAMLAVGVPRIVLPLAWGTGHSRVGASPLVRAVAATLVRRDYRDFDAAEKILTTSDLSWTIVYFGALTDRDRSARWRASTDIRTPRPLAIPRDDLARFLVTAAESDTFARHRVVLNGDRT